MFKSRRKTLAQGERVCIISPSRDTAADFISFTNTNALFHRPWVWPATGMDAYRHYLERLDGVHAFGFLVASNDTEELVGIININDVIMGGHRSGSLGYYGSKANSRRGYMTEGLALVLDQAFGPLGLHRVEANVQPGNAASLALIAGLGFRREGFSPKYLQIDGVWCDHERWAMCEDEWTQEIKSSKVRSSKTDISAHRPISRTV